MAEQTLVTVAMPVCNAQQTVAAAIRSILRQTYREWEFLVIDDGSNDASAEIASSFGDSRLRLVTGGGNLGLAVRLNQAIDMAHGGLFARMDADDIAYPRRLEAQVEFLRSRPEIDIVGCGVVVFDDCGRLVSRFPIRSSHAEICSHPWRGFFLPHPTWMGRREWFMQHRYGRDYRKTQDQDLLLRTFDSSQFACVNRVLLGYRQERRSLSKLLRGRGYFTRSIVREAWRRRAGLAGIAGVAGQALKAVADILTVPLGMDRVLRAEDAAAFSDAEQDEWRAVWMACNLNEKSGTQ